MSEDKVVLAYASQYKEKYYFNENLGKIPEEIKKEVLVLLISLVEEAGGVAEMGFDLDGEVYVDSWCEEGDLGYDEISAWLPVREIEREQRSLLDNLALWYRAIREAKRNRLDSGKNS